MIFDESIDVLRQESTVALSNGESHDDESNLRRFHEIKSLMACQLTVNNIRHHSGLITEYWIRQKMITKSMRSTRGLQKLRSLRPAPLELIGQAQPLRRNVREPLRDFEPSNRLMNQQRHTQIRLEQTYDRVAAKKKACVHHKHMVG